MTPLATILIILLALTLGTLMCLGFYYEDILIEIEEGMAQAVQERWKK